MQASFQQPLSFSYPQVQKITGSELNHALPSLLLRCSRIEKIASICLYGLVFPQYQAFKPHPAQIAGKRHNLSPATRKSLRSPLSKSFFSTSNKKARQRRYLNGSTSKVVKKSSIVTKKVTMKKEFLIVAGYKLYRYSRSFSY